MNTRQLCLFIKMVLALAFFSGCVSVSLQKNDSEPAKNLIYRTPASPFSDIKVPNSDKAWLSHETGNTISFLSDCAKGSDPSLEQMLSDGVSVLDGLKILDSKTIPYNNRSAMMSTAVGFVDGVPVKTQVLVFKKNNCNYTLTYAGVSAKFDREIKDFEEFRNSFTAP